MRLIAFITSGALLLSGCATYPPAPSSTVNAENITYAILTELYCAANDLKLPDQSTSYFGTSDNWIAAVDLNLSASIEGSAAPTVSLLGPANLAKSFAPGSTSGGTFTVAFGGTFDQTRTNLREYKTIVYMKSLLNKKTGWESIAKTVGWNVDCRDPNRGGTYLTGRLGLRDWLTPAVYSNETTLQLAPPSSPDPSVTPPKINKLDRTSGAAGTSVTIEGTNLMPGIVTFGNVQAMPSPGSTSTSSMLKVTVPPGSGTVPVVVTTAGGYSSSTGTFTFKYTSERSLVEENIETFLQRYLAAGSPGGSSGGAQTPTISSTITFTIKATGTVGPSFALSRVSGGSGSLFSLSRTDNNYVNIVLTPATYCATVIDQNGKCLPPPPTTALEIARNAQASLSRINPQPFDVQAALSRIDASLINLNLAHLQSP